MSWAPRIERWRSVVHGVAPDLPVELILGIIWHESRGDAGAIGKGSTKPAVIPSSSGPMKINHALGLMQVVPKNIAGWNAEFPKKIATWEQLTSSSVAGGRKQIMLGAEILRGAVAWVTNRYRVPEIAGNPNANLYRIALMVYAWGQGNMRPYLDQLQEEIGYISLQEIAARWPDLGAPKNHPVQFSNRVWKKAYSGGPPPSKPIKVIQPKKKSSRAGLGLLALAGLVWATTRR